MKEYDLFVPLYYNDGTPIEPQKLRDLQDRLLGQFEGQTFLPHPNEGFWRMGEVMYRDQVVIFRVITAEVQAARAFLTALKEDLKRDLRQEEVLIIERDVQTL